MCSGKMQNGAIQAIKLMVIIYIYFAVIHWPRLQSLQSDLGERVASSSPHLTGGGAENASSLVFMSAGFHKHH